MIKILPKKLIAAIIVLLGYSKIIIRKYGIILLFILLSIFLAYKCYFYKQLSEEFEREVRDLDNYATELEEKLEVKENINNSKVTSNNIKKTNYKNIYIPDIPNTHREVYIYQEPQKKYVMPQIMGTNYGRVQDEAQKQRDQEVQDRRIMELETKVNNYEIERDMRLLH